MFLMKSVIDIKHVHFRELKADCMIEETAPSSVTRAASTRRHSGETLSDAHAS